MKKYVVVLAALCLAVFAVSAFASDDPIGACIYKYDDTFMTNVRRAMLAEAEKLGETLDVVDSQNRQPLQNDQ
ncbi:MAG: methyl-galactoside ABC transporter substrate-binding protein, partial [Synergistaceae bacterium]|nr:methyl-galactoside ABC transporter substrate-binding protein [Synergistaceae bacterium]